MSTALESLSDEGIIVKATRYAINSWPATPEAYSFLLPKPDESVREGANRLETNDKCVIFQNSGACSKSPRFEPKQTVETVSARETRFQFSFLLKEMAPPCDLCWEEEIREQDIRILVDNISKYDLEDIATPAITGPEGELQKTITEICIESRCQPEAKLVKSIVAEAIHIRQQQITRCTSRNQYGWLRGEKEELSAKLKEFIASQTC